MTRGMILATLKDYANPDTKLSRLVKEGKYFPLGKGLYETDKSVAPQYLAGFIYGPSYVSFEFALSHYGLIPERVYTITSATAYCNKTKYYENYFGHFLYKNVPAGTFPYGIKYGTKEQYHYRIACPEKALCDQLYKISPVTNMKDMADLLFEDLRIDEEDIRNLDFDFFSVVNPFYHCTNIKTLIRFLRKLKK